MSKRLHFKNFTLDYHGLVTSTMDVAQDCSKTLTGSGLHVILADQQTQGRGRLGRQWHSPHSNFYATFIVSKPVDAVPFISFVAAVAAGDALLHFAPHLKLAYKWPNDLLVDGKKMGGILIEVQPSHLLIGVGINLKSVPQDSNDLLYPVTHLMAQENIEISSLALVEIMAPLLQQYIDACEEKGFQDIRHKWIERAAFLNQPLKIRMQDKLVHGTFEGLDPHGAMLIKTADGLLSIYAGDVAKD